MSDFVENPELRRKLDEVWYPDGRPPVKPPSVLRGFLRHWWFRPELRAWERGFWGPLHAAAYVDHLVDENKKRWLLANVLWGKPIHPLARLWDRLQLALLTAWMVGSCTVHKVRWS